MATSNENAFNLQVMHAIDIEGFKNGLSQRALDELMASDPELASFLYDRVGNVTQRGYGLSATTQKRIEAIITALTIKRQTALKNVFDQVDNELSLFAQSEMAWQTSLLSEVIPATVSFEARKPALAQLRSATRSRPFQGRLLKEWYNDIGVADRKRLRDAIRIGYQEGLTTDDIVRSIMGTRKNNFTDGILNKTRNEVNTVVRTATNHYANGARQSVFEENSEIISGLRYTATLDGRTSPICASLDGNVYDVDKGPRPAQHPNCRSIMVAVIDGVEVAGRRPYVADTRTRKEREVDFRQDAKNRLGEDRWSQLTSKERNSEIRKEREKWADKNIGQVNSKITYEQWLKGQPAKFQDDVLGPTKGKLFREGGLSLDKFVSKSGHVYTIDELKQRNTKIFNSVIKD